MPTVSRFFTFIASILVLVLAVTLALAYLVPPDVRPMTAPVDPAALANARRTDAPPAQQLPASADLPADDGAQP